MIQKFKISTSIMVLIMMASVMLNYPVQAQTRSDLEDEEVTAFRHVNTGKAPVVKSTETAKTPGVNTKSTESTKPTEPTKPKGRIYVSGVSTYVSPDTMIELSATSVIPVDKIYYRVNSGNDTIYNGPFALQKEGVYIINHYSIDKLGNRENVKVFTVIVDATPPDVTLSLNREPINGKIYISRDLLFTITAKDSLSGVSTIEYTTDGTNYTRYEKPFHVQSDKDINLSLRVTDNVGNLTNTFIGTAISSDGKISEIKDNPVKLSADTKAPVVQITTDREAIKQEDKLIVSADFKYTVTAEDTDSGINSIMVKIDGQGEYQPYKDPIIFTTGGKHTIEAVAYDNVGNKSTPVILSVFVNVTPPVSNFKIQAE